MTKWTREETEKEMRERWEHLGELEERFPGASFHAQLGIQWLATRLGFKIRTSKLQPRGLRAVPTQHETRKDEKNGR